MKRIKIISLISSAGLIQGCTNNTIKESSSELPNILWITCEDISPYLGCYGDPNAFTPNLDKLASEGVMYSNAYANAPVCAPARFTIITGMYASTTGTHNMRSRYKIPEEFKPYPLYLREAGYYCTNHVKQDFNTSSFDEEIWDERSPTAHYKNRPKGKPFFSIFNLEITHERFIHKYNQNDLVHDPDSVVLPPYHPDVEDVRNDWAKFYDNITYMDAQVGILLKDLERAGLTENTIIIFYGDHGGVLGRSKRFIYNTGTRVPLIAKAPPKFKHLLSEPAGISSDRLVSFVDLAPTLLSIAGIDKPKNMQGQAFLGKYVENEPNYVYFFRGRMDERYDMMRGICDKKYRYIVNFMPNRPYSQHLNYLWRAGSMRAWENEYLAGRCNEAQSKFWQAKPIEELYDMENDPWEVNNLAENPKYKKLLKKYRSEMKKQIINTTDAGFIPEGELVKINDSTDIYSYIHSENCNLNDIVETAYLTIEIKPEHVESLVKALNNDNIFIKYWGVMGLLTLNSPEKPGLSSLKQMAKNETSEDLMTITAELLYKYGEHDIARKIFKKVLKGTNDKAKIRALNAIELLGTRELKHFEKELSEIYTSTKENYIKRIVEHCQDLTNKLETRN